MPYTLANISVAPSPRPSCAFRDGQPETEASKFDPLGAASNAIASVSAALKTVKTVVIGTAVAVGFLVVWNVFVK